MVLAHKYPITGFMSDGFGIGWNVVRLSHELPLLAPLLSPDSQVASGNIYGAYCVSFGRWYDVTPVEAFKVGALADETGFVVALVYSHFKCSSVGRLSGSITFTPKVGVDDIGSGWERQDESWSKIHDGDRVQVPIGKERF